MLLRVKHHALSVYDPVSAGLHCPHGACLNAGRVNLYHVFWTCPAANRLRTIFVDKWKAAGLRMESYERAIFALTLQEEPTAIIKQTGSILADCMDVTIGDLGGIVESIVEQCWALGAAQYLHAVWRWRVAFFDEHNNTTREYHEANFKARLRSSHAGLMSAHNDGVHNTLLDAWARLYTSYSTTSATGHRQRHYRRRRTRFCFTLDVLRETTTVAIAEAWSPRSTGSPGISTWNMTILF
jgi:hypothetical protein